jgi:tetratricopeptide (TPR) repeat protein
MAKKIEVGTDRKYVRTILPWALGAGLFVFYLATLNRWISFGNLQEVAKVAGYAWQPELYGPLSWLVTRPFRLLPASMVPLALNIFAAVCASLTLALLARSIALWPQDRTHGQRQRDLGPFSLLSISQAWVGPVVGVLVCGLQLTFWEYATSANTLSAPFGAGIEMLDLLLFAYVVRCLLEFRIDQRESWLLRGALVFGIAMTSNWAMIGFFPILLVALIWLQGLAFFNARFLVRMFLAMLAGLSLYLLLPIVNTVGDVPVPFWAALKLNLGGEKQALSTVLHYLTSGSEGKQQAFLLALTSFIPLLLISIKWAASFGDTSKLGVGLSTFVMNVVHALFLVACLWVMLDPPFSPRAQGFGLPFLTLTYLAALSVGYLTGYFLMLFQPKPAGQRRGQGFMHLINVTVTACVWLLAILTPVLLVYKNWPIIRITNGPTIKKFASLLAENIPPQNSYVLSDDVRRLFLTEAAAVSSGKAKGNLFIDTSSLPSPEYHHYLRRHHPDRWPFEPDKNYRKLIDPLTIRGVLMTVAQTNSLYYLHPSFGYFFEAFCLEPHGPVYKLARYPTNTLTAPLPGAALLAENSNVWARVEQEIFPPMTSTVTTASVRHKNGVLDKILREARAKAEPNKEMRILGSLLSRSLDYWGVLDQRAGDLSGAGVVFERTLDANPDNTVAKVNLECNRNLRAGRKPAVQLDKAVEEEFGKFRSWDQIMNEDGPFDEPTYCFKQGLQLVQQSLYRQAATEFARVHELAPDHLYASLWLAQLFVLGEMPDKALKIIDDIHAQAPRLPRTNAMELLYVELSAHLASKDLEGADKTALKVVEKYPSDEEVIASAAQVFMNFHYYSNALPFLDRQLALAPDDINALSSKGLASVQVGAYQDAIEALTKVLNIETNSASDLHTQALFGRAVALLKLGKLGEARRDYEALQRSFPTAYQVYYGLGEIAYQLKETNAAIRNYELYLTNSPPNPEEIKGVERRLKELEPPKP